MSDSLWCINAHMVLTWKYVDEILKYVHSKVSLVSYQPTDEWLICVLRAQYMISKSNVKLCSMRWYGCRYFFKF